MTLRAWRVWAPAAVLVAALMLSACESTGDGVDSGTDAAPGVAALPPGVEIDDNPERLMGLDPDGVQDLLGTPDLVRRESPAQIWQYRAETCVLDVVIYEETDGTRVTYVEARDRSGTVGEARPCLNTLLRARLGTS